MKSYNAVGLAIILSYALACAYAAPAAIGPWGGLAIGAVYGLACWFVAGIYLADVLHLGVAHRALDFKPWFIKTITILNNLFGIYVGPTDWVNRHRLHHKHSDHEGDPNKLADDGLWGTLYLCIFPYRCKENVANDPICQSLTFRVTSHWLFILPSQIFNYALLSWLVGGWAFAAVLFLGIRVFAIWVNMIQNYWTHTRTFGYRRYEDERDNAMNIGEWLPVTATFSACLQNNHHHYPNLLRLSHSDSEYDFGLLTIKAMKALGLVTATPKGVMIPADVSLSRLGF